MKITKAEFKAIFGTAEGFTSDLKAAIAAAVAQADAAPENSDLLEEIREVKIHRDHAIAEFNEITAALFKGSWVYQSDIDRILGDRASAAKAKILGLPNKMARVLRGTTRDQALDLLHKEVEQIEKSFPEFDPANFRATTVIENPPARAEEYTEAEEES
jgi:molybdopterin-biosynthesis enzyme MoeA-like protein